MAEPPESVGKRTGSRAYVENPTRFAIVKSEADGILEHLGQVIHQLEVLQFVATESGLPVSSNDLPQTSSIHPSLDAGEKPLLLGGKVSRPL